MFCTCRHLRRPVEFFADKMTNRIKISYLAMRGVRYDYACATRCQIIEQSSEIYLVLPRKYLLVVPTKTVVIMFDCVGRIHIDHVCFIGKMESISKVLDV